MSPPRAGVVARFDASAPAVFGWLCRVDGGDLRRCESLLADTFASLRTIEPTELECLAAAYTLLATTERDPAGCDGINSLTVQQRAVLDLALVQRRADGDISAIIGVAANEVGAVVVQAQRASDDAGLTDAAPALLRANEHWLDDEIRARARAAIVRVEPTLGNTSAQSRRVVAAVAVGCAALIAVVAIWVIPTSSRGNASPDTEPAFSPAPFISAAPPALTPPPVPGYIATDLPSGFALSGIGNYDAASSYDHQAGYFELWAQPNATRTLGRWFAAVASNGGLNQDFRVGPVTRVVVHNSAALHTESADGITEIVWEDPVSLAGLDVIGHGFTADEFVAIANSIQQLETAPTSMHPDTELRFEGAFDPRAAGFNRIISTPTWSPDMANQPSPPSGRYANYSRADSSTTSFSVTTTTGSQRAPANLVLQVHTFLSERALDVPPLPGTLTSRGPVELLVSLRSPYFLGGSDEVFRSVEWVASGELITVTGNVSLSELVTTAGAVRNSTATEWTELLDQRRPIPHRIDRSTPLTVPNITDDPALISTTSAGERWTATVTMDPDSLNLRVEMQNGSGMGGSAPFSLDPLRPVHSYSVITSTLLLVALRDSFGATAARFTVGDLPPVTVFLTQVPTSGAFAAAFAYSEVLPVTVELIDTSGAVVRPLTP